MENSLTPREYAELTRGKCFYCGRAPFNPTKWQCDVVLYNGVDRIDNHIGYTRENVVTCCKDCNQMKSQRSPEAFFEAALRVANNYRELIANLHSTE